MDEQRSAAANSPSPDGASSFALPLRQHRRGATPQAQASDHQDHFFIRKYTRFQERVAIQVPQQAEASRGGATYCRYFLAP